MRVPRDYDHLNPASILNTGWTQLPHPIRQSVPRIRGAGFFDQVCHLSSHLTHEHLSLYVVLCWLRRKLHFALYFDVNSALTLCSVQLRQNLCVLWFVLCFTVTKDSSVREIIGYMLRDRGSIPDKGRTFRDQLWDVYYSVSCPMGINWPEHESYHSSLPSSIINLITHLYIVPMLRICEDVTQLLPYAFIVCN
jgi:hypothetical protein